LKLSDAISDFIQHLITETSGIAEIQRNELASKIGCVPSQINYVITSRFTPEQGYIVESRRGGGGYIRITKIKYDYSQTLMHIINNIGTVLDTESARLFIANIKNSGLISNEAAILMSAALSDTAYRDIPHELRDKIRASIFKQMLINLMK
jgi:transcriptional regulator CtsR